MLAFPQAPIERLHLPQFEQYQIQVYIKRDDLIHPQISGNKFYKLRFNIDAAIKNGCSTLLTFGGAYSNHIHATAFAAKECGLKSAAIIRGEQIYPLNPTLKDCVNWGMQLFPVTRKDYLKKQAMPCWQSILDTYPNAWIIPEGGANELGVQGAETMMDGVNQENFDVLIAACGTGTTLAGIIRSAKSHLSIVGVPVLKGAEWMHEDIKHWVDREKSVQLKPQANWDLWLDYHWGGYGKRPPELCSFIEWVFMQTKLPLDPIYTGKAFWALTEAIKSGRIPRGARVLFLHTGGIQGARA